MIVDLTDVSLAQLLAAAPDANLTAAVARIQAEADRDDPDDGISAFNSSL